MAKQIDPTVQRGRSDRSLKGRAKDLLAKGLSIKIAVFLIGTGLLIWEKIDTWTWLALAGIVITGRFAEKMFRGGKDAGR